MEIVALLKALNIYFGLHAGLLPAICSAESDFRNVINRNDPSYGICQIMIPTARGEIENITEADLMIPSINALVAALHVKRLSDRYGKSDFFGSKSGIVERDGKKYKKRLATSLECIISAYNSGSCLPMMRKGDSATKQYVEKVLKRMEEYK